MFFDNPLCFWRISWEDFPYEETYLSVTMDGPMREA
jgi:hypothetical protein